VRYVHVILEESMILAMLFGEDVPFAEEATRIETTIHNDLKEFISRPPCGATSFFSFRSPFFSRSIQNIILTRDAGESIRRTLIFAFEIDECPGFSMSLSSPLMVQRPIRL
jgi:hypothetical protein